IGKFWAGRGGRGAPPGGNGIGGKAPGGIGNPGAGKGASCFLDFLPLRRPKGLTSYEGMANHP
ncbi:MAG TPA: hypothetical protein QGI72_04885, partial [Poseidonia sp.]|nr:hypothetical protein [Poseidonia sp.]